MTLLGDLKTEIKAALDDKLLTTSIPAGPLKEIFVRDFASGEDLAEIIASQIKRLPAGFLTTGGTIPAEDSRTNAAKPNIIVEFRLAIVHESMRDHADREGVVDTAFDLVETAIENFKLNDDNIAGVANSRRLHINGSEPFSVEGSPVFGRIYDFDTMLIR